LHASLHHVQRRTLARILRIRLENEHVIRTRKKGIDHANEEQTQHAGATAQSETHPEGETAGQEDKATHDDGAGMNTQTIIMTWPDHVQLTALVEAQRYQKSGCDTLAFQRLAGELARARLVASHDIPPDVVSMDSRVCVRDLDSSELLTFTLSWPERSDAGNGRVNVLAPLGMALLGSRVGQEVEWPVPGGTRRLRVEAVLFQPENGSSSAASRGGLPV